LLLHRWHLQQQFLSMQSHLTASQLAELESDFIAGLASVAPYLIISALYGWFMYFNEKAKTRPSRKSAA